MLVLCLRFVCFYSTFLNIVYDVAKISVGSLMMCWYAVGSPRVFWGSHGRLDDPLPHLTDIWQQAAADSGMLVSFLRCFHGSQDQYEIKPQNKNPTDYSHVLLWLCGAPGWVVNLFNLKKGVLDSWSTGHVWKPWASFEHTALIHRSDRYQVEWKLILCE